MSDTFVEEGSGLTMELGRWYVLSDSGSAYTSEGFESPEAALEWCEANDVRDARVPKWQGAETGWDDMDVANILLADHLREWWESEYRDHG